MKIPSFCLTVLLLSSLVLMGCHFCNSLESASTLDQAGKSAEAIAAYQNYLKSHPATAQASRIYYRIGKNDELLSDYPDALKSYETILNDYPKTDEAAQALLDIAALYRDKLKDSTKATEYDQKAFSRYMDNAQLRDAVQPLIEIQYQNALASFNQKDYKTAENTAENIFQVYPAALLLPVTHDKVKSLADRAHRAASISQASVDLITLTNEDIYDQRHDPDFAASHLDDKILTSPDGKTLVTRKKSSGGTYHLYEAKIPDKGKKPDFKMLRQTSGAGKPSWSPDGQELVYFRNVDQLRKLEKINLKTMKTESLFSTKSQTLGLHPVFHPSGNKIAFVYEGLVCLINNSGTYFKQLLKTKLKLDYTAELEWSTDGTQLRCRQTGKQGKTVDELLALDVLASNNP